MTGYGGPVRHWFAAFWFDGSSGWHRILCGSVSLAFLAYPLADLSSGSLSPSATAVVTAGFAAFVLLYLRLFWILPSVDGQRRADALVLVSGMATIALGLAAGYGGERVGLLVYVSVAAALGLPSRFALIGIAATAILTALLVGPGESVVLQAVMFGLLVLALRRLSRVVEELHVARERVAELAVSEERLRLSRDLHDLLGHNLSVIALKGELAGRLIDRGEPAAAAREIGDVESVARASLKEARDAVRGLRRANLRAELRRAQEALDAASIKAIIRTDIAVPEELEGVLGYAVREAATNVIRHSGAHRCEFALRATDDAVELEVRDDGVGGVRRAEDGDGSGLRGLTERLAEAGGTLEAGCAPSGGFRLVARVPTQPRGVAE